MTTDWAKQTVHTFLFKDPMESCSESLLEELGEDGIYWYKCRKFVKECGHFQLLHLSPGQMSWLYKIKDGLIEEAKK